MSLKEYQKKRDFKKTKEPAGIKETGEKHIFVIQKHYASHLHYDFRLELDGVLKSWAVPKGPPKTAKEKRLAVEVEDHPVSYAKFEGTIPEGEYGAGTVEIWDKGVWIPLGNPQQQLKKGHLEFELKGKKLSGRWMLIRTQMKAKKANWLLIKRSASAAPKKSKVKSEVDLKDLPFRKMPHFVEPELCSLVEHAPAGENWVHEVKFDGYRSLARKENKKLQIFTRSGLDWTAKYLAIAGALNKIKAKSFLIDGEIAWIDDKGRTQFDGLQNALQNNLNDELVFYVFDLLYLNGKDLRDLPLIDRKKRLEKLIKPLKSTKIVFSQHQTADGDSVYKSACHLDLEGIISKNTSSRYSSGRGTDWVKTKCTHTQEFVIGGFSVQANKKTIAALLLGEYTEDGTLKYVGRVGTGFNSQNLPLLIKRLSKLGSTKNPFSTKPSLAGSVQWVKPTLVANIEFGAWTSDHILRHAAFKGLREDKKAEAVTEEVAVKINESKTYESTDDVKLTHPEKVLYKEAKIKKIDLFNYYKKIQKWIMPHIADRPLSLLRCPSGQGTNCFFQKHFDDENEFIKVTNLNELLHLVQMNTLELHAWNCHLENMDKPDQIVFDLDPDPSVSWKQVKEAAFELKDILDQLKLKNYIKVSGNKGLHIHVPVLPIYTWAQIKNFSKSVCDLMVSQSPEKFTTQLMKKNRKNKIFLDYLRNGEGATAIVPYSVRATPQATVALPISWSDLEKLKAPNLFTIKSVIKLLAKKKDPWIGFFKVKQKINVLDLANSITN